MPHAQTVHRQTAGHTLVLGDPFVLRPVRLADRLRARVRGASLDQRLAAGRAPESSLLLAARAQRIVALPYRESLARSWEHVLRAARRSAAAGTPGFAGRRAVPLNTTAIVAAERAIRELIGRLAAPLPVTAQGVAAATLPLANAASPVFSRLGPDSLADVLDAAIAQLDPARPLIIDA